MGEDVMKQSLYSLRRKRFNWQIFVMAMAGVLFLFVFAYIPMAGIVIGFKDMDYSLNIMKDLYTKPFVGLNNFIKFVQDAQFRTVMTNTLALGLLELVFTFPLPVFFALMLNEIRNNRYRKVVRPAQFFLILFPGLYMAVL